MIPLNLMSLAVSAVVAVGTPAIASTNLVAGGDFELPDTLTYLVVAAGGTALAPWTVDLVSVDVLDINNGFTVGPAFDGRQYLDLDGTPGPGQITQLLTTTPGEQYDLTFAYANNYSVQSNPSATVRVFDSSGDLLSPQTITHNTSAPGNLNWTLFTSTFTAVDSSATLQFTSLSAGGNGGIMLDAIAVLPHAVPELPIYPMLALGLAVLLVRLSHWPSQRGADSA